MARLDASAWAQAEEISDAGVHRASYGDDASPRT